MSLTLRVDDCTGLPSMENWLNAGADWTGHHGIIEPPASTPLFYNTTQTSTTTGADSMFATLHKETPFLKLDTLELCKENSDAVLVRTGSSSMVDSSSNDDEISEHVATSLPSTGVSVAVSSLLDHTPSLDETNLSMEADSPRGPLSPAALQLGKSPRTTGNKRSFDDLQAPGIGYAPFVAMANSPSAVTTFLPASGNVAAPGILFPTPIALPSVPSMEEIAQSRPKRRNVRISKDPQSVAARHRRERISDRVRVLQHFVPGGTKMDTASMLDEAIQYVKFLQHQLQTLERLGNAYDPRFMGPGDPRFRGPGGSMMIPQVRPFDLNCAAYQTYPSTSMMQASPQPQNTRATSPFCSQEQFCQ